MPTQKIAICRLPEILKLTQDTGSPPSEAGLRRFKWSIPDVVRRTTSDGRVRWEPSAISRKRSWSAA